MSKLFPDLGFGKLKTISFGTVTALILFFVIFNASAFIPEVDQLKYILIFLSYGIFGSYLFARQDIQSKLTNISVWKAIPIFAIFFFATLLILYFLLGFANPFPQTFLSVLAGVPLWLLICMAFIFATVETSMFQGILYKQAGFIGSAIIAGFFHMFVWTGSLMTNLLASTGLFLTFNLCHHWFDKKGKTLIPVIAIHTAYNFIILGIILGVQ